MDISSDEINIQPHRPRDNNPLISSSVRSFKSCNDQNSTEYLSIEDESSPNTEDSGTIIRRIPLPTSAPTNSPASAATDSPTFLPTQPKSISAQLRIKDLVGGSRIPSESSESSSVSPQSSGSFNPSGRTLTETVSDLPKRVRSRNVDHEAENAAQEIENSVGVSIDEPEFAAFPPVEAEAQTRTSRNKLHNFFTPLPYEVQPQHWARFYSKKYFKRYFFFRYHFMIMMAFVALVESNSIYSPDLEKSMIYLGVGCAVSFVFCTINFIDFAKTINATRWWCSLECGIEVIVGSIVGMAFQQLLHHCDVAKEKLPVYFCIVMYVCGYLASSVVFVENLLIMLGRLSVIENRNGIQHHPSTVNVAPQETEEDNQQHPISNDDQNGATASPSRRLYRWSESESSDFSFNNDKNYLVHQNGRNKKAKKDGETSKQTYAGGATNDTFNDSTTD